MNVPHDLEAERHLLGDLLFLRERYTEAAELVDPADFYKPLYGSVFAALGDLYANGNPTDPHALADQLMLNAVTFDRADLNDLQTAGTGAWRRHAETVARHSLARRSMNLLTVAVGELDAGQQPGHVIDGLKADLAELDFSSATPPQDVYDEASFLSQPDDNAPWVIPGMLRTSWRAVIVAEEGSGKSWLTRQCAVAVAAGLHPLRHTTTEPWPTLIVDLENPSDVIRSNLRHLRDTADRHSSSNAGVHIWHRPQGIDLRTRRDRSSFVATLSKVRPRLVCLGPIYKCYRVNARESDEQVAAEVQSVLDDLRARFGFGLLLEHHAPHGETGTKRTMRPYGSSLWLRWPEFGIALSRSKDQAGSLDVGRWRGDRIKPNDWPTRLDRGGDWPWVGRFAQAQGSF